MSKGPNSYRGLRRTAATASVVLAGGLLLAGCESSSGASSAGSSQSASTTMEGTPTDAPTVLAGVFVDPNVVLNGANFCKWRLGTHPIPLSSKSPVRIRIDDRCNNPSDANPITDQPTGLYDTPAQVPANTVTTIKDGTSITVECVTEGTTISDASGNQSSAWLGVDVGVNGVENRAYIPDVNVGGGYTIAQLALLGVNQCVNFTPSPAHA